MTFDILLDCTLCFGSFMVVALACHFAIGCDRRDAEIDRLRRRIALYEADARDQQALIRDAFERDCG